MAQPLPGVDVPVVDQQGHITQIWYDYFQSHQKLVHLPDVSATAPTNGQVLTYVSATQKWTPS